MFTRIESAKKRRDRMRQGGRVQRDGTRIGSDLIQREFGIRKVLEKL